MFDTFIHIPNKLQFITYLHKLWSHQYHSNKVSNKFHISTKIRKENLYIGEIGKILIP